MASNSKKSFEFRMSKKVAELTQVVHMLFTRNHEKEVELEALKESYEYEIELVIKDAKNRIRRLESQILGLQKQHTESADQTRSRMEAEMEAKDKAWRERMETAEKHLQEERKDCQTSRDLLITSRKDMEKMKLSQREELSKLVQQLDAKNREETNLRSVVAKLQNEIKNMEAQIRQIDTMSRRNDHMLKELDTTKGMLGSCTHSRDELASQTRQLETEVQRLRRELSVTRNDKAKVTRPAQTSNMDYGEEMGKLQRELTKCRMELSNRESNFNRMFTEKQPLLVDRRAGRLAFNGPDTPNLRYSRSKTFHNNVDPATRNETGSTINSNKTHTMKDTLQEIIDIDSPRSRTSPALIVSASDHLPGVYGRPESRHRTRQLGLHKPKPPSREILSGKYS